jgi:hypothetical protein
VIGSNAVRAGSLALLMALAACKKDDAPPAPLASGTGTTSDAGATNAPNATGKGDAGATSATAQAASFQGTYTAKPATLYIPDQKDWSAVKQPKSDDALLVGDGTLTLAVGEDGRVTGTIDTGPAAPAVIDATKSDGEIRGTVRRKNPSDDGLTGVVLAKVEGTKLTGKLTLAGGNAATLREAAFTAEKK